MKVSKGNLIMSTFLHSAKSQLKSEDTMYAGLGIGLYQGLKYGGSLSRGIKSGIFSVIAICTVNGLHNVMIHLDDINDISNENKNKKEGNVIWL